ncbi:MAG TPA: hypothetical protein VNI61_04255 [Gemmatimonadales bacterium]|nr:hypothetical protein [Gemmatimonadales bacterium]
MTLPFPGADRAKHMGELRRGDQHWDVYLECQPDADLGAVRGRLHFVAQRRHRVTGWIFLEWQEREIQDRFGEFSAVELWHFVEAVEEEQVS